MSPNVRRVRASLQTLFTAQRIELGSLHEVSPLRSSSAQDDNSNFFLRARTQWGSKLTYSQGPGPAMLPLHKSPQNSILY